MKIQLENNVSELIKALGENVYVVGGYVRNSLSGLPPTDIDIAGPLPAQALKLPSGATMRTVNYRMGTALILCGNIKLEYTPFRTETYPQGGTHTPIEVRFTSDITLDARRRDFCCNAVYYNPLTDTIIDPLGGIKDIEHKLIRACWPHVFESDGLRLLRLARQAAELGFKIESATAASAKQNAQNLKDISGERKREELDKMLCADIKYGMSNAHYRAIKLCVQLELLENLLPSLAACADVLQPEKYHRYDVLEHSLQCLKAAPPQVRLAALLHDIGKAYCMREFGNMHGHERASAIMAESEMKTLRYPTEVIERVKRLCALHMYDMHGNTKPYKMRVFVAENMDIIDSLAALCHADILATGMVKEDDIEKPHRFLKVRSELIQSGAPLGLKNLNITGIELANMGLEGKQIGGCLTHLWHECLNDPKLNNYDWLIKRAKSFCVQSKGAE